MISTLQPPLPPDDSNTTSSCSGSVADSPDALCQIICANGKDNDDLAHHAKQMTARFRKM